MQAHFDDNPIDYDFLKHDKPLQGNRQPAEMKHVPNYLMPKISGVKQVQEMKFNVDKLKFNKKGKNFNRHDLYTCIDLYRKIINKKPFFCRF